MDEKLKGQFLNTCKYSNHDNIKFVLLLQKGVYPYEYTHERFRLPKDSDYLKKKMVT